MDILLLEVLTDVLTCQHPQCHRHTRTLEAIDMVRPAVNQITGLSGLVMEIKSILKIDFHQENITVNGDRGGRKWHMPIVLKMNMIFSSFELANTFCFRTFFNAEKGMSCVFCFIIFSFEKLLPFLYSFSI